MGRRPLTLGLARSERVEAKITPAEREALTARRGTMTESEAIRAAIAAWCAAGPLDTPLDARLVALVEQAVARGFLRAMQGRPRGPNHGETLAQADPIAREERAAVLAALADEQEQTLAARLGLATSEIAAVRSMKAGAPRLTDEQRVELGLAPRQLALVEQVDAAQPVEAQRAAKGMKRPRRDPAKRAAYEAMRRGEADALRPLVDVDGELLVASRFRMSVDELRLMVAADMRPAGRWLTDEQRVELGLAPLTDDERALVEWARSED